MGQSTRVVHASGLSLLNEIDESENEDIKNPSESDEFVSHGSFDNSEVSAFDDVIHEEDEDMSSDSGAAKGNN